MQTDVLVVGGGAAGIFAAIKAAESGLQVLLLEKTERLGTKIRISGGGKCNVAHDGPLEDVIRAFRPNEARFIRPACYRFTNSQIIQFFKDRGLEVYTRPNGRVFPVHQTAVDVVRILERELEKRKVKVLREITVEGLILSDGRVIGARSSKGDVVSKAVILCTGGSSYPKSGTTGDGWPWATECGHSIVKIRAALAPINIERTDDWAEYSGIALRDIILKARQNKKEIARWRDDLLFTHQGVSGPTVLGISREVAEKAGSGEITLQVDFLPEDTFESAQAQVQKWIAAHPKKLLHGFFETLEIPARLVPLLMDSAQVDGTLIASNIDKKARNRILEILKGWTLGTVNHAVLEKGEVVAGGISLDEVDPHTMKSKKIEGLYLCGEILDIAGPVGGYNLQSAFSTGFVAGDEAAKALSTVAVR